MAATYEPIATSTLGSAVSSYTFTSIPSTYTDLIIVANHSTSSAAGITLTFNSDTGNNYSFTYMQGNGSAASSNRASNQGTMDVSYQNANALSNAIIQIQNYANGSVYKTVLSRANDASVVTMAYVGLWRSYSAINSVKLASYAGNFNVGTTFTLYGIKAA